MRHRDPRPELRPFWLDCKPQICVGIHFVAISLNTSHVPDIPREVRVDMWGGGGSPGRSPGLPQKDAGGHLRQRSVNSTSHGRRGQATAWGPVCPHVPALPSHVGALILVSTAPSGWQRHLHLLRGPSMAECGLDSRLSPPFSATGRATAVTRWEWGEGGWAAENLSRGGREGVGTQGALAPSPRSTPHYPVSLHLQNSSSKIKL